PSATCPSPFRHRVPPHIPSALALEPSAILPHPTGTPPFVYVDLLPDLATARNAATGWRRGIYAALSMGFRGTSRQWRIQAAAGLLMSALIVLVFISVYSFVVWDLSMAITSVLHTTFLVLLFDLGSL